MQGSSATVTTMPQLANLLRGLRRRQSRSTGRPPLTYRQLAARTGWSHGIIGEYLAGRVLPPTDRFDALVRLLGATPAEQVALASARDRVEEQRAAAEHPDQRPRDWSGVAPRQLPADLTTFAGRTWQLALLDRLTAERRPIVLSGTAGVGKTALAVHWAHQVAALFPDGQLFLDLRGFGPSSRDPVAPLDALGVALGLLGVPPAQVPAEPQSRAALYRGLLRDKQMLIVLDNAATAEQVRPLLPGSSASLALVTSRVDLPSLVTADGARPVTLDLLDAADARTLLAGRIGAARTAREPEAVDSIVAACAGLPIALSVVAARAALHPDFSLAAIAADLSSAHGRLDALRSDDPKADVETVFSWSYQRLTPPAQRLFRLGGLHPSPELDIPAAAALADLPVDAVRPLLAELVRAQLIIEPRPGRFGMHDLLCAYAYGLAHADEPTPARAAARRRLIEHYTRTATTAAMLLNPSRHPAGLHPHPTSPPPEPTSPTTQPRPTRPAARPEPEPPTTQVRPAQPATRPEPTPPTTQLRTAGPEPEPAATQLRAASPAQQAEPQTPTTQLRPTRPTPQPLPAPQSEPAPHQSARSGGRGAPDQSESSGAEPSADWAPTHGGHRDAAAIEGLDGEPTDEAAAAEWFAAHRRALIGAVQVAVACGLDREVWRLAWAMADHLDRGGHWGDWIATQRAAVGAAERLGDTAALALAHRSLSGGYIRSGRHVEARRHLLVAFDLFVELADHAGAARCQHALAWLLETQDRFAEAVAHDERALDLFRLADDPVGQARALNSAGWHHARLGHHDLALECCEEALELQRGLSDAAGIAATLDSLGYVHHGLGEHDQAIECYQEALLLYAEQGDRFNEADTSIRLGDTWAAAGRWDMAREAWLRAVETLDGLAHPKAAEVRARLKVLDTPTVDELRWPVTT
ncbi:tetratricopeptide repeat protein [Dactylosporangium sp. NBC_01737]|uniref:ATP-binding protein n=1 Tax=Dactylosporangium sp. NBC_01737 TaxID=2975959 RepID=UPI002E0DD096|nr:tetratricopeptide repeat protein [Dactylosporangium sp. NBC_01737]